MALGVPRRDARTLIGMTAQLHERRFRAYTDGDVPGIEGHGGLGERLRVNRASRLTSSLHRVPSKESPARRPQTIVK